MFLLHALSASALHPQHAGGQGRILLSQIPMKWQQTTCPWPHCKNFGFTHKVSLSSACSPPFLSYTYMLPMQKENFMHGDVFILPFPLSPHHMLLTLTWGGLEGQGSLHSCLPRGLQTWLAGRQGGGQRRKENKEISVPPSSYPTPVPLLHPERRKNPSLAFLAAPACCCLGH